MPVPPSSPSQQPKFIMATGVLCSEGLRIYVRNIYATYMYVRMLHNITSLHSHVHTYTQYLILPYVHIMYVHTYVHTVFDTALCTYILCTYIRTHSIWYCRMYVYTCIQHMPHMPDMPVPTLALIQSGSDPFTCTYVH